MQIVAFKPDIVITEKGVSDLAQHYFLKAGITAFRRLKKTDSNRVARATGATIVNRPDEIQVLIMMMMMIIINDDDDMMI